jgi:rod shape-determining protein MreC
MSRFSISRRRAIAILALTSVLLITLDVQGNPIIDRVRGTFATLLAPLQDGVRVVTRPIENAWTGITDADELREENARLRDELARQEGTVLAALASLRDAQELLALNGVEGLQDIDSVTARVLGESPSNFSQTVEINRGSGDGIRVGMPVVDAVGLVGKITAVFPDRAVVMLVTDAEYAIGVKVVNNPNLSGSTVGDTTTTTQPPTTAPSGLPPGQNATTTTSTTTTTTIPVESTTTTVPVDGGTTTTAPAAVPGDPLGPVPDAITTTTIGLADLPATERGGFFGRGGRHAPEVEFIRERIRFGEIRVGAIVQTAGGSTSPAPENIVVGTVQRKIERSSSAGPVLEVNVAARLDDLNFVRVLLYQAASDAGE